jgi:RES domain-containing protein
VPVTAWRIVKRRLARTAFDGEGARLEGGRWNSPGMPVVYTSASAALAALEILVHLGRGSVLDSYVLISCVFEERLVTELDPGRLPDDWRTYPAPAALQSIGDEWLASGSSVVLRVPSVVVATEANYLLNPRHPDFRAIRVHSPQPFVFDPRLG